jgi:hypothetical protein
MVSDLEWALRKWATLPALQRGWVADIIRNAMAEDCDLGAECNVAIEILELAVDAGDSLERHDAREISLSSAKR